MSIWQKLLRATKENELKGNTDLDYVGYTVILENWYSAKPYGFRWQPREGTAAIMFLPINPSNLTITTNFATVITPTLYGTVEEHSPVRYYDISIEGTTGMGPKYVSPTTATEIPPAKAGRSAFTVEQIIPPSVSKDILGGFFNNTLNRAQQIFNDTKALIKSPEAPTAIKLEDTGYFAFHNLYRFLLRYKQEASGGDGQKQSGERLMHPLVFFNYKDNNEYNVVIKSMSLRRDKEDPMMYHYSISMRGYDLRTAGSENANSKSQTPSLLKNLGLDGINGSNFLQEAKKKAAQARGILGSVANGINLLGR